ncbi:hypothetical protein VPH35_131187 [Triticum aestivum]
MCSGARAGYGLRGRGCGAAPDLERRRSGGSDKSGQQSGGRRRSLQAERHGRPRWAGATGGGTSIWSRRATPSSVGASSGTAAARSAHSVSESPPRRVVRMPRTSTVE